MEDFIFTNLRELLDQNRLRDLRERLSEMNVVDIAEFIEELPEEKLILTFRILPKDIASDVFAYLGADNQAKIVEGMNDKELGALVDELYVDDAVDFIEEVPANVVRRVLANASKEMRDTINRFLKYPENSAGSLMTIEMVELHDRLTVGEAIKSIRSTGIDKETIYTCYVIDDKRHLIGVLPLRRLLLADETTAISDIMSDDEQIVSVHTLEDQEVVAELVRKYDLLSIPVVDGEGRLVGIITIDDIVDIIEEEATEDFQKMALMAPTDDEYLKTGVFRQTRSRIVWLLVLMVSATFTGKIITNFEDILGQIAGLTACIPMLMDTGGNAGNQTSTLIIRGLALGEIKVKDFFKVLFKELRVSLLCGAILAVANFVRMYLLADFIGVSHDLTVFFVVCASMLLAVVVAKCIGCVLPIAAKLVKLDPALMAGPMITTIVDAVTLLIYLSLAKLMLGL